MEPNDTIDVNLVPGGGGIYGECSRPANIVFVRMRSYVTLGVYMTYREQARPADIYLWLPMVLPAYP